MGRDAAKACENQCFRCRKEAAKHNDKLGSREGAAELLGISVSSLADYEQVKEKLIDITADGIISKDEWADLTEILDYLDGLIRAARELKLIGSKLLNGGADDG